MIAKEKREELLRTFAFFSFFLYPLSLAEARLYSTGLTQDEVDETVRDWEERGIVDRFNAMFALRGAKIPIAEQVAVRSSRYLDSILKLRRARWYISYLSMLPFIEGVALCNSIAWQFTKPESDTDLFLIVKPGHLFSARLFAVLPLMVLALRPRLGRAHAIDTNFFITSDALNISFLREVNDPYFNQWMRALIPLYEKTSGLFVRFFQMNSWSGAYPRTPLDTPIRYRVTPRFTLPLIFSERLAKWIEWRWFPKVIRETMNRTTSVVVTDSILKFHKNDRRAEVARHVDLLVSLWSSKI